MSTLTQLTFQVAQNRVAINDLINGVVNIEELTSPPNIQDYDLIGLYDTSGNLTTKVTISDLKYIFGEAGVQNDFRWIILSEGEFRLSKKPGNTSTTIEVGDIVTNGWISPDIFVTLAKYNNNLADDDIDNFGTLVNDFTDGNYYVEFTDFS